MATEPTRQVVIGAASIELRRSLGTTAWVVFEELLLASTGRADQCTASVSVRSIAASLGLAKDTVARALTRLRPTGLVTAVQTRTTTGVFAAGSYRLTVPDSVTVISRRAETNRRARTSHSADAQLALVLED